MVLTAGGIPQPVSVGILNNNQEVVLTPLNPLSGNTTYTITVSGIQDVAGNGMTGPVTTSFITGTEADLIRPSVVLADPGNTATGVATNATVRVEFSERIDPVSVNNGTIQVLVANTGQAIAGTATAAADGLSATFVAAGGLLAGTNYTVRANNNGVTDLGGNGILGFSSSFTTGQGTDTTSPVVVNVSPQNGLTGVALNGHIGVQFSEAMSAVSMESNPVVVTASGGGVVAGTLTVSGDHTTMTLVPGSPLAANTGYTVSVSGVTDVSGNVAPAFSSSFSTGTGSLTVRPSVVSVAPANGASSVALGAAITITFNGPLDGTTVNAATMPLRINGSILVNGTYGVNNTGTSGVVTFTPSAPLPPSVTINVSVLNNGAVDLAGNGVNGFSSSFTTGTQ
jgi:hypothetical protein